MQKTTFRPLISILVGLNTGTGALALFLWQGGHIGTRSHIIASIGFLIGYCVLSYILYDNSETDEDKKYTLTDYGRRNLRKLKKYFSETGFSKQLLLSVNHSDNTINGAFYGHKIDVTVGALNTLLIGGLKAMLQHEIGHYIHNDLGKKQIIGEFIKAIGFPYFGNVIFRFSEFYADKYAFERCGSRVAQTFILCALENIKFGRTETLEKYPSALGLSETHPSPTQRIWFLKNSYRLGIATLFKLIWPISSTYFLPDRLDY